MRCGDDSDRGYGRRRKRSVRSPSSSNSSTSLLDAANLIQKWEENLELKIRLPDDLLGVNNPKGLNFNPPLPLTGKSFFPFPQPNSLIVLEFGGSSEVNK